jgi:hypothetical protein
MHFSLREYLPDKLALRFGVSLTVRLKAFAKFVFELRISSSIVWMLTKPIAEEQLRRVCRCANMDVMRTTTQKVAYP